MFARGQRVGVAVSGGVDSVCLLYVLRELAPRWELALTILHVNHRLRGEDSEADAAFVRHLGAQLGLEVRCHEADVRRIAEESRENLEQVARRIRNGFFLEEVRRGELDRVALGHTLSDQAETVLFRFLRGAGTAGLAGIRPVTLEGFVRPLLYRDRAEVEAWLRERGLAWREDLSNRDRSFARNRIRHDLLPALVRDWNPRLPEVLAGMAEVARDEEDYWIRVVDEVAAGNLVWRHPAVLLRADWLARLPRAVGRRVARRAVECARGDLRGIDLRHIEQILALAAAGGSGRMQAPGLDVFRSFDWMRLSPAESVERREYRVEAAAPGRIQVPGTGRVVVLELLERTDENVQETVGGDSGYNRKETDDLDWGRISGRLELRNWRPGDRYRPIGHANETKIKTLFQDARIPFWDRRNWPVLTCGEEIVWSAGFGPAAAYAATPRTGAILRVREIDEIKEFCNPGSES